MPRKTTPRLSEALTTYQRTRALHLARSSVLNDQSVLSRFVEGVGDPQAHMLTADRAEAWFADEVARQQPSSFNKTLQRCKLFMRFCERRGWIQSDPLAELRPRRVNRRERLRLTTHQLEELIEGTHNPRDRGLLACAVNTALRASDLVGLRISDLDLDEGWLTVTIQKTGESDRLPVTRDLDVEMRRWLSWYSDRLALAGQAITPDMYLFPALTAPKVLRDERGRPVGYGATQPHKQLVHAARIAQRGLERLAIPTEAGEGIHTIRRSVARIVFDRAASEGHDGALRLTAALLGHKSTATTELYLGITADRQKRNTLLHGRSLFPRPADDNVSPLRAIER